MTGEGSATGRQIDIREGKQTKNSACTLWSVKKKLPREHEEDEVLPKQLYDQE